MKNAFFENGVDIDPQTLPETKQILHKCTSGACDHYKHFIGVNGREYYEEWNSNKWVAQVKPE